MEIKKVAITGSTGGLGLKICDLLAKRGCDLVLVDRNQSKSAENEDRLKKTFPNINIERVECDLERSSSVKIAAEKLTRCGVDAIILNSGIYNVPLKVCDSGYNNVFEVNFLSQYYLARKLCESSPTLKKVIATSSIAHNYSKTDCGDIDFSSKRSSGKIYGNSKRFLTFALYEYFEKNDDVALSIYHPGVTLTNITNHYPKAINWLVKLGIKIVFPSPKSAVRGVSIALDDDCRYLEWIGPRLFDIWGKPKKSILKTCDRSESMWIGETAERLFKEYEDLK